MTALLVDLRAVLRRHILLHGCDSAKRVRLVRQHEEDESNRLIEKLVVSEPGLVQKPLLPSVIPRREGTQLYLPPYLGCEISLSLFDRLSAAIYIS